MTSEDVFDLIPSDAQLESQYQELLEYIGLQDSDHFLILDMWSIVELDLQDYVDDFYHQIQRHDATKEVITGGPQQVQRLKATLKTWIRELFSGRYDATFLRRRWMVGWRHVKIGLPQKWTAVSMCRLRDRILRSLAENWNRSVAEYHHAASIVSRLMDLDLALIQDAYYAQSVSQQLQTERDFAESIIATTASIVIVIDEAGTILRSNKFVAQLVAESDDLPTNYRSIYDLLASDGHDLMREFLDQTKCSPSGGPVICDLLDSQQRRHTTRWFFQSIQSPESRLPHNNANNILLVGHDITDLIDAQRRAVQQERLAAIGQTMTGLAHESRNAFQRSQASLEMLSLEFSDNASAVEQIERIQRAHDHLLQLYEEVLSFAKPVRLELDTHRIDEIAKHTWAHIVAAHQCNPNLVSIHAETDNLEATCDAFAVEQVLRNLIENALAVTGDEDHIDVQIASAWQGEQPALRVAVSDHGPGVPEKYRGRLFEPFFSTKPRGTGLGLSIARRLVHAHGGTLEVKSDTSGTIATVVIPLQAKGDQITDPENHPDYRRSSESSA